MRILLSRGPKGGAGHEDQRLDALQQHDAAAATGLKIAFVGNEVRTDKRNRKIGDITLARLLPAVLFVLLLIGWSVQGSAQTQPRGYFQLDIGGRNGASNRSVRLYEKSYALVIGIDKYTDPAWPALSNAINDAVAIGNELTKHGFEVALRKDLNSDQLRKVIEEFIFEKGRHENARLFIWYAGHGHTISGEGYLVPSDAPSPDKDDWRFRRKALSLREFGRYMREARAKHVMTIFDSCFSGTVFSSARSRPPPVITKSVAQKVRQFISSGEAKQEVSDDGTFRKLFIEALNGADVRADQNRDGYLLGSELGLFLHQEITNLTLNAQTPRHGKLRAHGFNRGDFVFRIGPGTYKVVAPKTSLSTLIDRAQSILAKLGYKPGPADGRSGTQTRKAVIAYQRQNGLTPDGRVTRPLLRSMEATLTDRTRSQRDWSNATQHKMYESRTTKICRSKIAVRATIWKSASGTVNKITLRSSVLQEPLKISAGTVYRLADRCHIRLIRTGRELRYFALIETKDY